MRHCRKITYKTLHGAIMACFAMMTKEKYNGGKMGHYQCPKCGGFHITSHSK